MTHSLLAAVVCVTLCACAPQPPYLLHMAIWQRGFDEVEAHPQPNCQAAAVKAVDRWRAKGYPARLAIVLTESGEGHMVADLGDGWIVDNRAGPSPIDWWKLPYLWLERDERKPS